MNDILKKKIEELWLVCLLFCIYIDLQNDIYIFIKWTPFKIHLMSTINIKINEIIDVFRYAESYRVFEFRYRAITGKSPISNLSVLWLHSGTCDLSNIWSQFKFSNVSSLNTCLNCSRFDLCGYSQLPPVVNCTRYVILCDHHHLLKQFES